MVTLTEVAAKVATLATFVLIARGLGGRGFGVFSLGLGIGVLLASLASFGMDDRLTQLGGREPERMPALLGAMLRLRALFAAIALLGAMVVVLIVQPLSVATSVTLLVASAMADTFTSAFRRVCNLRDAQRGPAMVLVVQRFSTLALVGISLLIRPTTVAVSVAYLAGSLVGLVGTAWLARRAGVRARWTGPMREDAVAFLKAMHITGTNDLVSMALFRIDTILLGILAGVVAVGQYSGAYRLLESVLFVSWALDRVLSPLLANRELTLDRAVSLLRDARSMVSLVYLPYAAVLAVRGDELVTFLFGEDVHADHLTATLALAPWLFAMAQLSSAALFARAPDPMVLLASTTALVGNVALNFLLIPRWGAVGAGIATTVAYAIQAAVCDRGVLRRYGSHCLGRGLPIAAGSALGMAVVLAMPLPLFVSLALGGLVYAILWDLVSRRVDARNRSRVISLLRRRVAT